MKTAAALIQEHGSLEAVLAAAPKMARRRIGSLIADNEDAARLSHLLVTLRDDAPLPLPWSALRRDPPDWREMADFVQALALPRRLLPRSSRLYPSLPPPWASASAPPLPPAAGADGLAPDEQELAADEGGGEGEGPPEGWGDDLDRSGPLPLDLDDGAPPGGWDEDAPPPAR